jgi:LuxR family transcriptional regulator, maltose regulon positive regulatory protein
VASRAPISARSVSAVGDRLSQATPAFVLSQSKLRPPASRAGIVARTALVDRLSSAAAPTVIFVVAPAGYGKTTLLAQWAEHWPRVAWISADHRDNDPATLLTYLATALDRIEPIPPDVLRTVAFPGATMTVARLLASAIASMREPVALVIDDAEAITNAECLDIVGELALSFPAGSRCAIASRDTGSLPAARLRARGAIVEIGAEDLAMSDREAMALLDGAGVDADADDVGALVRRTEGWPAGLYLAALAMRAGSRRAEAGFSITGDDRFVGDYLRSELLNRVSRAEVAFLTRTSILDRMCGELCDAVVGQTGSGRVLEQLESRNLLVVPLDRRRRWYRYHHLFRELLHAELGLREPELVAGLHSAAARWYEANGLPEAAVDHAMAADDAGRVARLVLNLMQPVWASGRIDTVLRWIEWLEGREEAEHYSGVAAHAALILALLGKPAEAERWAVAAERGPTSGTLPDGNTMAATLAYMQALLCRRGIAQMRRDARLAMAGLGPASPYRATMLHTEALFHLLDGDPDRADPLLAHAYEVASSAAAVPFLPVILAERGLAAVMRDDWQESEAFADEALAFVQDGSLDRYWTSALVYAFVARCALHRGDLSAAHEHLVRAARLRPLLTYALPVLSAQTLLEMARCYLGTGDVGGARAVLRQARDIFQQRPGLGDLPEQAAALRTRLTTDPAVVPGASSLTTAELRLLPLLPTHLTLGEIGERLHITRNTARTHAVAIYRKLGVSSRGAAIARMQEFGLFPHDLSHP